MFKSLADWWTSLGDGADAAEVLIDEDLSYVSDDTLYELAEQSCTPDPETFVKSARSDLDDYHETERVKVEGTVLEKLNLGVLVDEEKHPLLRKFLPF